MVRTALELSVCGRARVCLVPLLLAVASCAHRAEQRPTASSAGSSKSRQLGLPLRIFFDREVLLLGETPDIWLAFDEQVPPGAKRSDLLAGSYEISIAIRDPNGRAVASACQLGIELPHPDPAQVTALWTL